MRGPPITITCECGEKRSLAYGERWTCEVCGRAWNTGQIPEDEYREFVRSVRQPRTVAILAALGLAAGLAVVALVVNTGLFLTIPIFLGAVAIFGGPPWKRWLRKRIAARPRWELHSE